MEINVKPKTKTILSYKTILTYGTFDLFHVGHLRLLKRLKALGDRLIVGLSTDKFNQVKGKITIIPFSQRLEIVEAIFYVDLVVEENDWAQKVHDIKKYNVDIFAMGDDWCGKFDDLNEYCQVLYLPRTPGVSSTEIKKTLDDIYELRSKEMAQQFRILHQLSENLK